MLAQLEEQQVVVQDVDQGVVATLTIALIAHQGPSTVRLEGNACGA